MESLLIQILIGVGCLVFVLLFIFFYFILVVPTKQGATKGITDKTPTANK